MSKIYTVQDVENLIKKHNLTQSQFAKMLGVNRITLSCILRKKYGISKANQVLLANFERKYSFQSNVKFPNNTENNASMVMEDEAPYGRAIQATPPKDTKETLHSIAKSLASIANSLTKIESIYTSKR